MNVLAVDAGTTSIRAALVDDAGSIVRVVRRDCAPASPASGLVEFDPVALGNAMFSAIADVTEGVGHVSAVGIANQRASTVLWDRTSGKTVGPGIGWQDTRTVEECAALGSSGLSVAPNQAPSKAKWLWDTADPGRSADLCVGTIDSWLTWLLTDGEAHVTDATNAHAAGLLDHTGSGLNTNVLEAMTIPVRAIPEVVDTYGSLTTATALAGNPPISAIAGDQQASMHGHGCFAMGDMKATFGTGGTVNCCLGNTRPRPATGSFPIIASRIAGDTVWGLEAIMLSAGSCVSWLCDLGIIHDPAQSAEVGERCEDSLGVWFVPAMSGLGAPYWDLAATGTIVGLTRGSTSDHIVRAVLEGIAHRGADLVETILTEPIVAAIVEGRGVPRALSVDGGMSTNPTFVQAFADASQLDIELPNHVEQTISGIANMALVGAGLAEDPRREPRRTSGSRSVRGIVRAGQELDRDRWREAVGRARS